MNHGKLEVVKQEMARVNINILGISALPCLVVWSMVGNCILGKEVETHSSILAWKTPWTEEPGEL